MDNYEEKLIGYLEDLILKYHSSNLVYAESTTLAESSKILEKYDVPATVKLRNTKFCLLEQEESIPQTSHIKLGVSYEVQEFVFVWENLFSLQTLKAPKDIKFFDEELILETWGWDDIRLPKEAIDNIYVDGFGIGQDLEEYFEGLGNIDYNAFPKALIPLIKKCVAEYEDYQKK